MSILSFLYPGQEAASVYAIDYDKLARAGYRGIIFDIDNTLVRHGAPADSKSRSLFRRLKRLGFSCCLLSNNKEPRVAPFARQVGASYICKARKPSAGGYRKAMAVLGTDTGNTVFIGDQLFTDIWGANRASLHTILVKPIHPKEEIQIVLKRRLEWIVLFFYHRRQKRCG